jgi:hypothetical protein
MPCAFCLKPFLLAKPTTPAEGFLDYFMDAAKFEQENFRSDQWGSTYNILMPRLPQDVGIGQRTFAS